MMAKLYFYYSSMNAGKSALLLLCNHNYENCNMDTLILTPAIDNRCGEAVVASRIGLHANALSFSVLDDLYAIVTECHNNCKRNCVFVDESQFLTSKQVDQLSDVCDDLGIPVITYGLRTDSNGNLFDGSSRLLAIADKLIEVKTICNAHKYGYTCASKATMVIRVSEDGKVVKNGPQICIGDGEYISVCRKHFKAIASNGYVALDGIK